MQLTFRQLQVFEAVARLGSVTRAAEELHLTQPAVSMQIRQLEQSVGLPLIEQVGKRLQQTNAGAVMAHHARLIAENSADIVLMGQPPAGLDVVAEPFMENPLVVIAAPDHELTRRRRIPSRTLEQYPFLIREPGSGTRLAMERFFSDHRINLSRRIEMSSNEAIKQSVEVGLGLGVVAAHTISLELEAHRLVVLPVAHFPIRRTRFVAHRAGRRLSGPARSFRAFVLAHAAALDARREQRGEPGTVSPRRPRHAEPSAGQGP